MSNTSGPNIDSSSISRFVASEDQFFSSLHPTLKYLLGGRGLQLYRTTGSTSQVCLTIDEWSASMNVSSSRRPCPMRILHHLQAMRPARGRMMPRFYRIQLFPRPAGSSDMFVYRKRRHTHSPWRPTVLRLCSSVPMIIQRIKCWSLIQQTINQHPSHCKTAPSKLLIPRSSLGRILFRVFSYYLYCIGSRANGNLRVNVQARLHETKLTSGASSLVQNEIQRIDVVATVAAERQVS